jgi:hypothetical protein
MLQVLLQREKMKPAVGATPVVRTGFFTISGYQIYYKNYTEKCGCAKKKVGPILLINFDVRSSWIDLA